MILHIGDICGIPQMIAKEQRRRRQFAASLTFPRDYSIPARIRKFFRLCKIIPDYDEIWFHYSTGLPFGIDLILWKALGKRIVMYYHGSDVRGKGPSYAARFLADEICVSTPDLLDYCPQATWRPQPIDFSSLPD